MNVTSKQSGMGGGLQNFRIPASKSVKKSIDENGNMQETLQCTKTLTERILKCSNYFMYGVHAENKLQNCGRRSDII
jgi:hypothetical protein